MNIIRSALRALRAAVSVVSDLKQNNTPSERELRRLGISKSDFEGARLQ
ncbi:hypothetical protein SAMN04487972_102103 [Paracoccus halophilus]|uniref:DUF1127 domain-containing protein n=1 Tax=Paracoccus halophilus TaxID=376733 RepID=A0A1I0SR37_9RHOB|nr:hypothetical protein [Paracoccus halophilus]SFA41226.1 hypothetical protein SAMN04487972_102103 [Paracoccus halophilus]